MKKQQQLGMNPGTASYRLIKDLLFDFIVRAGHACFRCGLPLERRNFSIDHKIPWLDSHDPILNFFDLNNIAFSHKFCNISASRRPTKTWTTDEERKHRRAQIERNRWDKLTTDGRRQIRRKKYLRYGC